MKSSTEFGLNCHFTILFFYLTQVIVYVRTFNTESMQAIFRELCASKNYSVFYLECQKDVHGKSQWLPLNRCAAASTPHPPQTPETSATLTETNPAAPPPMHLEPAPPLSPPLPPAEPLLQLAHSVSPLSPVYHTKVLLYKGIVDKGIIHTKVLLDKGIVRN